MNFRSQRAIERRAESVLFGIWTRRWDDRPTAQWQSKGEYVRVSLPVRTRCAVTRRRNLRLRWDGRRPNIGMHPWSSPIYCAAVALHSPVRDDAALVRFVEEAIAKRVTLIAAVGPDAHGLEYDIDRIIVGDKYDPRRSILTTAHDTMADAIRFVSSWRSSKRFFEVWL